MITEEYNKTIRHREQVLDKYHKQPLEVENSHWNSQPNRLNSRLHIVQDIFSDPRDKSKSILKMQR